MKVIKCPACGRARKNQKYCVSCGCYLPLLLEEEVIDNYTYISPPHSDTNATIMYNNLHSMTNAYVQSELTNVANNLNYEMKKLRSQINAEYVKLSQSMQTRYLINSLNYYHESAERDINGRIKRPGDYK